MVIAVCQVDLHLPTAQSLKDKRGQLKSLLARLPREFNLATAEVDYHDLWQSANIALVTVSTDATHARNTLEAAMRWIETHRPDLEIVAWAIELR